MKKSIALLLSLVMCLMLGACGGENQTNQTNEGSGEPETNDREISINESTMVDDFECRIKEVNWYSAEDFEVDLFDVVPKDDNYEYIVIVLSEKNTTNDTENAPMFNLLSADGQECTSLSVLSLYKNQYKVNFGATMANTTADAYVIYKIPTGAESFKLQIQSNGFGSSSDYICFDRNDIH